MAELLKGAPVAAEINAATAARAAELEARGTVPTLAILRVGEGKADIAYERSAMKRCAAVGVAVKNVVLPENVSQAELIEQITLLNADRSVHGVLMFSPLPKHLDEESARRALLPEKDVDGVTDGSLGSVMSGSGNGFPPCTAQACMEILDYYGIKAEGKRACVIGRSLVVGKPAALMLTAKNATVTLCHTKTEDLPLIARNSDIIIAAVGRAGVVGEEYFREGQTVIDVGINVTEDGGITGDCDMNAAEDKVSSITPVPGGVGAVTTAVLVSHTVTAAERVFDKE